jgi:hypothetical protein
MRVLIVALADYASVSQPGNKLNVMGVFDTIGAPAYPVMLPTMVIAIRLQLEYEDRSSTHELAVVIANQDGRELGRLEANVDVPMIQPGQRIVGNHILSVRQVTFQAPDKFSVRLLWDKDEIQRIPLDVVLAPPPKG